MRSQHCISCPEIPLVSGKEESSPPDICSFRAIRALLACTHCHGDLNRQFGPKMKSISLSPSLFSYVFSRNRELLGRIWPGWGRAAALLLISACRQAAGLARRAAKGPGAAGRLLPQPGNASSRRLRRAPSSQVVPLQSRHRHRKRLFSPLSRSDGVSKNRSHAVPRRPGEGEDAGGSRAGLWKLSLLPGKPCKSPRRAVPRSPRPSVCPASNGRASPAWERDSPSANHRHPFRPRRANKKHHFNPLTAQRIFT